MSEQMYNANEVEKKTQEEWVKNKSFEVNEDLNKPSFYCLSMLPYPSGELHMGHVRNYTLGDVISRFKLMKGYQVLQPLGWDAFGLPAENAAIKNKTSPYEWTISNINNMRQQLMQLGLHVDWSREITTCSAEYYKWSQWLFIKLYEKGLAYQKESFVNWDPVDETVLANEQVVNGCGWRSGAPIVQKKIKQWFFKTTVYANELLDGLDELDGWPNEVKTMQKNWIGRSKGVDVKFNINDQSEKNLIAFTTRVETIYGVSYIALATDHPLSIELAQQSKQIKEFINNCKTNSIATAAQSSAEKTGINTELFAINPINGKKTAIWICNYVIPGVGTGCLMGVPAHDARDYDFAKKYNLEILPVIQPKNSGQWDYQNQAFLEDDGIMINSHIYNNLTIIKARQQITQKLVSQASGGEVTNFKLRDWGISRQRYWGTPIPIIHCNNCGIVPELKENLPIKLPILEQLAENGNSLDQLNDFINTVCPTCGQKAKRETDTMDTFVDSSWYFLRYTCPDQKQAILDDRVKFWTPIDQYIGGIEHAIMHLLYARFMHKVIRDLNLVNSDEPFKKLLTQGMVLKDGQKMSKSKGNTVSPQKLITKYGADTIRLYSMFTAPPEQTLEWSDNGVDGAHKFIKKLWATAIEWQDLIINNKQDANDNTSSIKQKIHNILQQVLFDYERQQFNTVVSGAMKLLNTLQELNKQEQYHACLATEGLSILLRILAPIAPHICQELWVKLKFGTNIFQVLMPTVNEQTLKNEMINIIIQVNGKLRGKISSTQNADKQTIISLAKENINIQKHIENKTIKKTIVVPGKLVNFVL